MAEVARQFVSSEDPFRGYIPEKGGMRANLQHYAILHLSSKKSTLYGLLPPCAQLPEILGMSRRQLCPLPKTAKQVRLVGGSHKVAKPCDRMCWQPA